MLSKNRAKIARCNRVLRENMVSKTC